MVKPILKAVRKLGSEHCVSPDPAIQVKGLAQRSSSDSLVALVLELMT